MWSHNTTESNKIEAPEAEALIIEEVRNVDGKGLEHSDAKSWLSWMDSGARRGKFAFKFWNTDTKPLDYHQETSSSSPNSEANGKKIKEDSPYSFALSAKVALRAAFNHFGRKWYRRLSYIWRHAKLVALKFWKLWVRYKSFLYYFPFPV